MIKAAFGRRSSSTQSQELIIESRPGCAVLQCGDPLGGVYMCDPLKGAAPELRVLVIHSTGNNLENTISTARAWQLSRRIRGKPSLSDKGFSGYRPFVTM